ncbi:hypothetical protein AB0J83_03750 [Actinoplanes sp. NPDC049596]|uniref:WXG100-like domain-containing protein n=1 Tax=unclassified Actinoplanes TaxID=2626549 RepID=UPI00343C2F0E
MALEVSDELNQFQRWLTGEQFPSANEDLVRALAQTYHDVADQLAGVLPLFTAAVDSIRAGVSGESEQAFAEAMDDYLGDDGLLAFSGKYVHRLGDSLADTATEVEYVKLMIIVILVELLIEFLTAMAVAWLFPGVLTGLAARLVAGRSLITAWLLRAGVAIASAELVGIGMQVLMDLIVQAIQIRQGHRRRLDVRKTLQAVEVGALGGAVGLAVGALGDVAGRLVRNMGLSLPRTVAAALADYGHFAAHAGQESTAEALTEGLWGVMTGQGWSSPQAGGGFLSGLVSSAASLAGEHTGVVLRHRTGSGAHQGPREHTSGAPGSPAAVPVRPAEVAPLDLMAAADPAPDAVMTEHPEPPGRPVEAAGEAAPVDPGRDAGAEWAHQPASRPPSVASVATSSGTAESFATAESFGSAESFRTARSFPASQRSEESPAGHGGAPPELGGTRHPAVGRFRVESAGDAGRFTPLRTLLDGLTGGQDIGLPKPEVLDERFARVSLPEPLAVTRGPGITPMLAQARAAADRSAGPVPVPVPVPGTGPSIPSVLTDTQWQHLVDRNRAAVRTSSGVDSLFDAVAFAGRHDPGSHRLAGVAGMSAADLRSSFAAVLRADLALAGTSWPLLGLSEAELPEERARTLAAVTALATPGVPGPQLTPDRLLPAIAEVFGVRVVLVGPDGEPSTAGLAGDPELLLVADDTGSVMTTVPSAARPGTVFAPREQAGQPSRLRPPDPALVVPGPGGTVSLNPIVYPAGTPKNTLPHLSRLVEHVVEQVARHGGTVSASARDHLAQRLLGNYRALTGGGLIIPFGTVEALFVLTPGNPRVAPGPAPRDGSISGRLNPIDEAGETGEPGPPRPVLRATEVIQGNFRTGAYGHASSSSLGATRVQLGFSGQVSLDGGLLTSAGGSISASATINAVNRSVGGALDSEVGQVEDTRGPATLIEADAVWHLKIRTTGRSSTSRGADSWADIEATRPDLTGAPPESLSVWIPDQYLTPEPPVVTAFAHGAAGHDRPVTLDRIPRTYFASHVTGMPAVLDAALTQLHAEGLHLDTGTPARHQLTQAVWALDANLGEAINDPRGYRFTISRRGRVQAEITIRSRLTSARASPVGATSERAHIERVHTAISASNGSFTLGNGKALQISLRAGLRAGPALRIGPSVSGSISTDTSETASASRNALWVHVNRFTGPTAAFRLDLTHEVSVQVHARPVRRATPASVAGSALVRMPEEEAFRHGLPVRLSQISESWRDSVAELRRGRTMVPFGSQVLPRRITHVDAGGAPLRGVRLPRHVLDGRGIGQGLTEVDESVARRLLEAVIPPLQRHNFIPRDLGRPFDRRGGGRLLKRPGDPDSHFANLELLYKMIFPGALNAFYNDIHQDGMSFTLTRHGFGRTSYARITITARPLFTAEVDARGNSVNFRGRSADHHTVNLAMGLDVAGRGTADGTRVGVTGRAGLGFGMAPWLRDIGFSAGYRFARGASASVSWITNTPQLLEYSGAVDEFALPSRYTVTVDFSDGPPATWTAGRNVVDGTALVRLVPGINQPGPPAATGPATTPPSVLDQAVVYHLDGTGVLAATRAQLTGLAGPAERSDQAIVNFTSVVSLTAHMKEIANSQYTTDLPFRAGLIGNSLAGISIAAGLGPTTFVGVQDQYVLGLIRLRLTQAAQNSSAQHGIEWSPLDVRSGAGSPVDVLSELSTHQGVSWQHGWERVQGARQTGGKEFLDLNFQRVYAFRTEVTFEIRSVRETQAKVLPESVRVPEPALVGPREMVFLLSEPDALEQYAQGNLPVPGAQLADLFARWSGAPLPGPAFSSSMLARTLARWQLSEDPEYAGQRAGWADRIAAAHRAAPDGYILDAGARAQFARAFPDTDLSGDARPVPTFIPPYLTGGGVKALGHSGFHHLVYEQAGTSTFDLVHQAIEQAVPGLLAKRHRDWAVQLERGYLTGPRRVTGRQPGGIDMLQAMLSGGRDLPLVEDMVSEHGVQFSLINKMNALTAEGVLVTLKATLGEPHVRDHLPGSGLENYGHAYAELSLSHARHDGVSIGLAQLNVGGAEGTTASMALTNGRARHRSSRRADENIVEQTVYDWNSSYRADLPFVLTITVERLDMPHRELNNAVARLLRGPGGEAVVRRHQGTLAVKLPPSLLRSPPLHGPAPLPDLSPLPGLPADAMVSAALLDDALPAARRLFAEAFGRSMGDGYLPSLSLPVLLSRSHLANHLPRAVGGSTLVLAEELPVPGRSHRRAKLSLHGELYDLTVVTPIERGTGTGRYAKYLSTDSVGLSTDLWSSSLSANVAQGLPATAAGGESLSTSLSRQTANNVSGGPANNPRREQHGKRQGPVHLVRLHGRFFLDLVVADHRRPSTARIAATHRSEPITGEVYLTAYADQIDQLRRDMLSRRRTAPEAGSPAWPADVLPAPLVDLDRAGIAWDAHRAAAQLAGHLRTMIGSHRALSLSTRGGLPVDAPHLVRQVAHALDTYLEIREHRGDGLTLVHRADPRGRLYELGPDGLPLSADQALRRLPDGLHRRVEAARSRFRRLGPAEIVRLHENSWSRQQTFEQAVRAALAELPAETPEPAGPPVPVPGRLDAAVADAAQVHHRRITARFGRREAVTFRPGPDDAGHRLVGAMGNPVVHQLAAGSDGVLRRLDGGERAPWAGLRNVLFVDVESRDGSFVVHDDRHRDPRPVDGRELARLLSDLTAVPQLTDQGAIVLLSSRAAVPGANGPAPAQAVAEATGRLVHAPTAAVHVLPEGVLGLESAAGGPGRWIAFRPVVSR